MTRLSATALLRRGLRVLVPLSALLTVYLYLYPVFKSCAFPLPPSSLLPENQGSAFLETAKVHWHSVAGTGANATVFVPSHPPAPFRLLALGDPQLEGDTSIPTDYLGVFPHLTSLLRHVTFRSSDLSLRHRIRLSLHDIIDIFLEDTFDALESLRKRIDLFGNDFYLAHIYRTVHWWTRPTHVAVLGDLVGSQWLDEDEFYRRADRYWKRVFRGAERVPDDLAAYPADEYDLAGNLGGGPFNESTAWTRRIVNVAGNHDIGYAGDITEERVERFERAFGKLNYELRFELPLTNSTLAETVFEADGTSDRLVPELRIVVLNDMNLDTPAASTALQDDTYAFINSVINTAAAVEFKGHFTLILTHVPLYKPEGVCVDDPFFDFHEHDGSLKEQNQLSGAASKGFLEGILGMSGNTKAPGRGRGRRGIILNGHDHEGCDTWHYINQSVADAEQRQWEVKRWRQAVGAGIVGRDELPGVREITVRSMMGDFGGNAGLLSVWFDEASWEWKAEYATCPLGKQHLWWVVHILDLVVVVGILLLVFTAVLSVAGIDVDKAVEESILRLCTLQRKVAQPSTSVRGSAPPKDGGSGS
ncbi:904bb10c-2d28-4328-a8b0-09d66c0000c2 [Thermothielavioides terrestris]|uniref:Calcineurin-like phosphoesterase domain-containing protein n=2 Tax=Thermothielavioides terrestris TaxID=2587410 RepID=G2RCK7_THETT|nr:uncharacterized protein THITE_2120530 [Thermothielavioides terrestris NRRL 8126]AEO69798.1 hypothetical protein THITE_2120530 [Thermothielavioides terrestris NRRL 8126]SPQ17595.1 904bb10c-2d28-4328-a8b0-09d66c0000c2 [Thermothielavioides terrestris]